MRLIDADELKRKVGSYNPIKYTYEYGYVISLVDIDHAPTIKAEPQTAYEQGVKDTLDKYDETCRIASNIRTAFGINTAKECWELVRNGEIQRVKHGRWIRRNGDSRFMCSVCKCKENVPTCNGEPTIWDYCPNCGAQMDEVEND